VLVSLTVHPEPELAVMEQLLAVSVPEKEFELEAMHLTRNQRRGR